MTRADKIARYLSRVTSPPTPYYESRGVTIYHGIFEDIAAQLAPGFDAIITDPPYLGARGESWEQKRVPLNVPYSPATGALLIELVKQSVRLVPNGWIVIFQDFKGLGFLRDLLAKEPVMLAYAPVIWCKPAGAFAPNGSANSPCKSVDFITVARQGQAFRSHRPGHYVSAPYNPSKALFRTGGKPLDVMEALVKDYTAPGHRILDPFIGGGTTLLAARNLGRSAVGVEIDESICEIAAKRLEEEI